MTAHPLPITLEKPCLFWGVKDPSGLSERAVLEAVLRHGDMDDFIQLRNSLGIDRNSSQTRLRPLVGHFADSHSLARGTARALQVGHRRSIDFDFSVSARSTLTFQGAFNQRLFREQLCSYEDLDFSEEID